VLPVSWPSKPLQVGVEMDPRILMYLSNTEGMTDHEVMINDTLIKLYMSGMVEAKWKNGEPLFSISMTGEEEYMLAYASQQKEIEE
jgi:acyl-CoA hydrolase